MPEVIFYNDVPIQLSNNFLKLINKGESQPHKTQSSHEELAQEQWAVMKQLLNKTIPQVDYKQRNVNYKQLLECYQTSRPLDCTAIAQEFIHQ